MGFTPSVHYMLVRRCMVALLHFIILVQVIFFCKGAEPHVFIYYPGFVRALEILENPGKSLKPWKPLEKPWKFFLLIPGKSCRTLLKKLIHEMVHFVNFITNNNRDCRFSYHFKTSFCVRNHCLVLKRYTWSTLLLYSDYINYKMLF